MQKEFKLSRGRKEELEKELRYLKTVREKEVAELIKEARSFGDLSENSEYDEAKTEQGKLYSRIAEIENILAHSIVIDDWDMTTDRVTIGCQVVVKNLDTGEEDTYKIVGSQEANPMEGRISEESPFGKALVGKKAGEAVDIEVPDGTLHYKIISIDKK
ncbi:MAG: transcription elongation factor GreA [Oscillospiraceae bacterium]